MSEISVSEKILSEDYADLILPVTLSGSYFLNAYMRWEANFWAAITG